VHLRSVCWTRSEAFERPERDGKTDIAPSLAFFASWLFQRRPVNMIIIIGFGFDRS